jgi:hypothetical protein
MKGMRPRRDWPCKGWGLESLNIIETIGRCGMQLLSGWNEGD